jgi:hypothetical protein
MSIRRDRQRQHHELHRVPQILIAGNVTAAFVRNT